MNRGEAGAGRSGAGQVKRSDSDDVARLWAFGAVNDLELDVLSLFERPEPRTLDRRVVNEDVQSDCLHAAHRVDEPDSRAKKKTALRGLSRVPKSWTAPG